MLDTTEDPKTIEVWVAMAEHFLDTETRHAIPLTALRCIEAGLTTGEARDVWRFEVTPVVGHNLLLVAGEWAGWDRAWLVRAIRLRGRRRRFPWCLFGSPLVRLPWNLDIILSIERFMDLLLAIEDPPARKRRARDLASLARHCFDFCPDDYTRLSEADLERLRALYPEPFGRAIGPALLPREVRPASQRIRDALGGRTP